MPNLPGFLMLCSGMNSEGLSLGSQSVGTPKDGSPRFAVTGVPSAVAGRELMEGCRNVDEAERWLKGHPLARCVGIAACDREKQAVFEVTTKKVAVRKGDEGWCCATNHFRHADFPAATKCWRYDVLQESGKLEQLKVADVAEAMNNANQGAMTIHTMVFEPKKLRLHLSMGPGPASAKRLTVIELEEMLRGKNPQFE
jgi:isopenicillin-N N-acyltransferase-like protein